MTNQLRDKAARQLQEKLKLESLGPPTLCRASGQLAQQTSIARATPKLQTSSRSRGPDHPTSDQLTEVDNAISAIQLENQTSGLVHLLLPAQVPLSLYE